MLVWFVASNSYRSITALWLLCCLCLTRHNLYAGTFHGFMTFGQNCFKDGKLGQTHLFLSPGWSPTSWPRHLIIFGNSEKQSLVHRFVCSCRTRFLSPFHEAIYNVSQVLMSGLECCELFPGQLSPGKKLQYRSRPWMVTCLKGKGREMHQEGNARCVVCGFKGPGMLAMNPPIMKVV